MTAQEIRNQIATATGANVTVKSGKGSMVGYTIFSVNKNNKIDFTFRTNFVKLFPVCDIKPAFSSDLSIMIYHGIEG